MILVRPETTPDDSTEMVAAKGISLRRAVVEVMRRSWPGEWASAVVGTTGLFVDAKGGRAVIGKHTINEGTK